MLDWLDELKWKPILSPRGGLVQILATWHIGKQAKLACNYFNLRIWKRLGPGQTMNCLLIHTILLMRSVNNCKWLLGYELCGFVVNFI